MNLTKCFAASLCVTAMTASAGFLGATNDFEGGTLEGIWTGGVDAFDIVDVSTGFTDANSPITGVTDNKLLKLDTEGGVWTNEVSGGSFALTPVYVDMLVKFVPSEELPTLDSSVKLAVAVTNGFLVVTKSGSVWNSTTQPIDTNLWYRFSAELKVVTTSNLVVDPGGDYWDVSSTKNASVKINGNPVTVGGENVFLISDFIGSTTLTSIGFQGTGFIDEVTVRTDDPFGALKFAGSIPLTDEAGYLAWLGTNSIAQGSETAAMYNAFLWDVAPDGLVSPTLKVSSITVGANIELTLAADYTGLTPDVTIVPANLNNGAQVNVLGKVTLADPTWENLGSPLTFNPVVGANTNQFFKVDIAVPAP